MLELENKFVKIAVNPQGGVLTSFFDKIAQKELLWQGQEKSWTGQDVIIFPWVGRLIGGKYMSDDKEYSMPIHGLCTSACFQVVEHSLEKLIIQFDWSEDTLKNYPFKFSLKIVRELKGDKLTTTMIVENIDKKTMYYGCGFHPAFNLPYIEKNNIEETQGNYIEWQGNHSMNNFSLYNGSFLDKNLPFEKVEKIDLSKALMQEYKTLLLNGDIPRQFALKKSDNTSIYFDITDAPILAMWSHEQYGGYICIEPWWGTPDFADCSQELKEKQFINALASGEKNTYSFTIALS